MSLRRFFRIEEQVGTMKAGFDSEYGEYWVMKTAGSSSYSKVRLTEEEAKDTVAALQKVLDATAEVDRKEQDGEE